MRSNCAYGLIGFSPISAVVYCRSKRCAKHGMMENCNLAQLKKPSGRVRQRLRPSLLALRNTAEITKLQKWQTPGAFLCQRRCNLSSVCPGSQILVLFLGQGIDTDAHRR
jgi:hypothetical protein